ncbi:MAG TPA: GTPase Era [Gaiellales bacterium]|nr:GTPase Era [Gaiellales bacterium]
MTWRSGFVALAGRPNVGKSTLVNRLVGDHVAAVSGRPQTTRRRTLGVVDGPQHQLVLIDLPGFQKPFDRLTERMQRSVDEALGDADATLLMLSAVEPIGRGDRFIAERVMRPGSAPCVIAVNKIDRVGPQTLAPFLQSASELGEFHSLHPVSALRGDGVAELRDDLVALLPEGPRFFPQGMTSDQTLEQRIAESIREAALAHTRDEVPHALAVTVEELSPTAGGTRVEARLICETESQKGILIGRGGAMIKRIGSEARVALEAITAGPVMLELTVKVRPHWRRDSAELGKLGA